MAMLIADVSSAPCGSSRLGLSPSSLQTFWGWSLPATISARYSHRLTQIGSQPRSTSYSRPSIVKAMHHSKQAVGTGKRGNLTELCMLSGQLARGKPYVELALNT